MTRVDTCPFVHRSNSPEGILAESSSVNTAGAARVNIRVISDSYVGMNWSVTNVEVDLGTGVETQTVAESSVPQKA